MAALTLGAVLLLGGVACGGETSHRTPAAAFAWLHPALPPADWRVTRSLGGTLGYPPGWIPITTDRGTASVALLDGAGRIDGYLNATPGKEPRRRPTGAPSGRSTTSTRAIGASVCSPRRGVCAFAPGGSCVIDEHTTAKATYREIACLVSGRRSGAAVIVAAAAAGLWDKRAATLERAVSSFAPRAG